MASSNHRTNSNATSRQPGDSAVAVLRSLEADRHEWFSPAEYREMRQAVIEELAHGARCRPFTLFTFGTVGVLLVAFGILGAVLYGEDLAAGVTLILISLIALLASGGWLWSYFRGLRQANDQSLDERLAEAAELKHAELISPQEYDYILGGILNSRQSSRRANRLSA